MNEIPIIAKIAGSIVIIVGYVTMWFYMIVIAAAPVWLPIILWVNRSENEIN